MRRTHPWQLAGGPPPHLGGGLAGGVEAGGAEVTWDATRVHQTGWSGWADGDIESVDGSFEHNALLWLSLRLDPELDRMCRLRKFSGPLDATTVYDYVVWESAKGCDEHSSKSARWESPRLFVRALQVCTTRGRGGKDEVRGIRLWPALVGAGARSRPATTGSGRRSRAAKSGRALSTN